MGISKRGEKNWKSREQVKGGLEDQLFFALGIEKSEEKEAFLNPDYDKHLRDPFGMLGMDKAVERILLAIKNNEKIVLFGDYDADGIGGAVVFYDFFKKIGFENFEVYIPDRNKEGYGLTLGAIDKFAEKKVDLIITIDCGITDCDEVERANGKGIDTVILDHHLEQDCLPKAVAVVDVKQKNDKYPFDSFCGAGVAFKTVEALLQKGDFNVVDGWNKWFLDVVCISTVADMVPLVDENRVLVHYGLKVLKQTQRPGLLALFKKLKMKKENITEDDLAFFVGPRINVASRMDTATTSFNLLVTENSNEADWIAERLDKKNTERKDIAGKVIEEVESKMKDGASDDLLFFGSQDWEPGVLGVVANRLLERYNKPVVLWGKGDSEKIKGSSRCDGSVNLVDLMNKVDDSFFVEKGGHAVAAGFTAVEEKIEGLGEALKNAYKKIEKIEVDNELWVDKEIALDELTWSFLETIEKFSPFGVGNPRPNFLLKDLEVSGVKMFGNGGIHLQLDFEGNGKKISAVGFFMSNEKSFDIKKGTIVDLVANVERNTFMNRNELRLKIVDYKIK
ncbi:MAG: single-stranded-DNA-specific exonuclease RecJ [Candidatus Marinimicrobia bacterium]|nr:single-stranded-DNA-specific exonuclease RecJ [Candidatus Neomarinimicrobiota bacterium]